jgi:hypothetical protein
MPSKIVDLWLMQWRHTCGHFLTADPDAAIKAHPEWQLK